MASDDLPAIMMSATPRRQSPLLRTSQAASLDLAVNGPITHWLLRDQDASQSLETRQIASTDGMQGLADGSSDGGPDGIRTRVSGLKGRRPRPAGRRGRCSYRSYAPRGTPETGDTASVALRIECGSAHLGQRGGEPLGVERFLPDPQVEIEHRAHRGGQRDRQQRGHLLDEVARRLRAHPQA